MDAATITALASLVVALGGMLAAVLTNRSSATRAETDSLRETIELVTKSNERLDERLQEKDKQIGELEERIKRVDAEWRERVQILELGWKSTEQDYQRQITELKARVRALEAENEDLKAKLEKYRFQQKGSGA